MLQASIPCQEEARVITWCGAMLLCPHITLQRHCTIDPSARNPATERVNGNAERRRGCAGKTKLMSKLLYIKMKFYYKTRALNIRLPPEAYELPIKAIE